MSDKKKQEILLGSKLDLLLSKIESAEFKFKELRADIDTFKTEMKELLKPKSKDDSFKDLGDRVDRVRENKFNVTDVRG